MRVHSSLKFLTILAAVAACGAPAESTTAQPDAAAPAVAAPVAAAPAPVVDPAPPSVAVNVRWDSRPLDLAYRRERADLDAMHARERSHPRDGESADQRSRRQAGESSRLEIRYTMGKKQHSRGMPPAER